MRIFIALAFTTVLLVPVAMAQKPPSPAPPPSAPPSRPAPSAPSSSEPIQPGEERVLFLVGRIATNDGTTVPTDAMVERICNNSVRQQVHASPHGDFSMQLGSRNDSFVDASGDPTPQSVAAGRDSTMGISRRQLTSCDLRASVAGFHSAVISLVELDTFDSRIDVGDIVVHRATTIEGLTLDAAPYKAPKEARSAYEKGLEAERKVHLANARKYFEKAVAIYPEFTNAWFQLGNVLQKENQGEAARAAYIQATTIDTKFLPPYLSLAVMAYEAQNWSEVLKRTGHILNLDPLKHAASGYILDLDSMDYTGAYFYNSVANFELNKMEDAENSALKAEHLDLRTRFPQLHVLLAEIFARKKNYATAIAELQSYLELAPHASNAAQVREQLAKLEKLNGAVSASEKPDHQ